MTGFYECLLLHGNCLSAWRKSRQQKIFFRYCTVIRRLGLKVSKVLQYFGVIDLFQLFFRSVDAEQSVVICFQQVLLVACFRFSHLGWVNLDYNGNLFTKMEIISEQRIKIFIPGIKLVDTNNQNSYGRGLVLGIKYTSRQLAQRL